jgi:hypothetical protein
MNKEVQFGNFINSVAKAYGQTINSIKEFRDKDIDPKFETAFRPDRD